MLLRQRSRYHIENLFLYFEIEQNLGTVLYYNYTHNQLFPSPHINTIFPYFDSLLEPPQLQSTHGE